jgi:hypothetical protein
MSEIGLKAKSHVHYRKLAYNLASCSGWRKVPNVEYPLQSRILFAPTAGILNVEKAGPKVQSQAANLVLARVNDTLTTYNLSEGISSGREET